jgi:hypothetical protein
VALAGSGFGLSILSKAGLCLAQSDRNGLRSDLASGGGWRWRFTSVLVWFDHGHYKSGLMAAV